MFNKEENNAVSGSKNQSPSLTMISEGTKLNGTINTQNDIRIAGKTDGELTTKGKLIVTSTGVVEGDVKAQDADIAGKINGELRVSNKMTLRQSAVVEGDIYTKTLVVEEGAEMNGAFRMGAESTAATAVSKPDAFSSKEKSESPASGNDRKTSGKKGAHSIQNGKYVKA